MLHKADKELKLSFSSIFNRLPEDSKRALKEALMCLRKNALKSAKWSWEKHKAPMALYWKVVGVYAGHIARSIKLDTPTTAKDIGGESVIDILDTLENGLTKVVYDRYLHELKEEVDRRIKENSKPKKHEAFLQSFIS
jgi:hypothetical protein